MPQEVPKFKRAARRYCGLQVLSDGSNLCGSMEQLLVEIAARDENCTTYPLTF